MTRELGNELVNAFGARLRMTFEADASLPDPVVRALDRLREGEGEPPPGVQPAPAQGSPAGDKPRNGAFFSYFLPIGGTS